jgi:predicted methyltransferase
MNDVRISMWQITVCAALALALVGCQKPQSAAPAAPAATSQTASATVAESAADGAAIQAALTNPNRLAGDADEDGWRKSAEVLTVLGARPGMQVLDYFSAGGYNTELLSYVVGPQGRVIAYNNPAYLKYSAEKPAQRYGANRLPNVAQLTTPTEELPLEPATLDAALFVLSYHDLHWPPSKDGAWPKVDPAASLAKLVPALKPGAAVVVVDHVALPNDDTDKTVDALHRIDPAVVKREFEAAGLQFVSESDALRSPADDHTKPVFDKSIQHKTDRFIYKFVKPAA